MFLWRHRLKNEVHNNTSHSTLLTNESCIWQKSGSHWSLKIRSHSGGFRGLLSPQKVLLWVLFNVINVLQETSKEEVILCIACAERAKILILHVNVQFAAFEFPFHFCCITRNTTFKESVNKITISTFVCWVRLSGFVFYFLFFIFLVRLLLKASPKFGWVSRSIKKIQTERNPESI